MPQQIITDNSLLDPYSYHQEDVPTKGGSLCSTNELGTNPTEQPTNVNSEIQQEIHDIMHNPDEYSREEDKIAHYQKQQEIEFQKLTTLYQQRTSKRDETVEKLDQLNVSKADPNDLVDKKD
jgi:hypothetical protein